MAAYTQAEVKAIAAPLEAGPLINQRGSGNAMHLHKCDRPQVHCCDCYRCPADDLCPTGGGALILLR